ncbi:MAG: RidA family protein [Chloroflexi bacterium]|nr:RidA family protein [Chloroflexota bacterium]
MGATGLWSECLRVGDMVFMAGQTAWDLEGNLLGIGNPGIQARTACANIKGLLEQAGATLSDVVKITVYVTDVAFRPQVYAEITKAFGGRCPCSTGVVVQGLARPELLVEIDAIAVIAKATDGK